MNFVHEDPGFDDLLQIVAGERGFSRGIIEKDYWAIHSLWHLQMAGFDVWFKGGTSLSKGFRLIERFSEDLDLKIDARLDQENVRIRGETIQAGSGLRESFGWEAVWSPMGSEVAGVGTGSCG